LRGIFEFRGFDDFGQQHFRGIQAEVTGAGLDSAMLCGVHRRFLPEYRCRVGCLWVAQINQIEQTRCFGGAYVECSGGVRGSVWFFLSLGLSSPSPVL